MSEENTVTRRSVLQAAVAAGLTSSVSTSEVLARKTGKTIRFVETTPVAEITDTSKCGLRTRNGVVCTPKDYHVEDGVLYLMENSLPEFKDGILSANAVVASHGRSENVIRFPGVAPGGKQPKDSASEVTIPSERTSSLTTQIEEDMRPKSAVMLESAVTRPSTNIETRPEAGSATVTAEVANKSHTIPDGERTVIEVGETNAEILARRVEKKDGEIKDTRTTMTATVRKGLAIRNHGNVSVSELSTP
ncbi:hypothetical protein NGM10_01425 [Halorussus salilacus]|uniref:hypothetical protein n=1 Tax=Halorussus salilacus TaxID=2953750 RepID=UPI0020A096B8|nr:hypothetical protein [Halorussus salilacus]USZ68414.1 hypothetical protein NGM10_01425 [Halorussus salilacus]